MESCWRRNHLYGLGSNASGTVFQNEYNASSVCPSSPCSLISPVTLWNDTYTWWVKAYNPAGWGAWSVSKQFTTNGPTPLSPVLKNPTGTITTSLPNFTW